MRKILAILAGLIAIPAAYAADKGGSATGPGPVVAQGPGETLSLPFSGLYIGGAIGAADGKIRDSDGFTLPRDGLTASGLLGYNHRMSNMDGIVVGAEGDLGLTDISGSQSVDGFTIKGSTKYLGSVRGRIGKAVGDIMLYATAGVAMTDGRIAVDGVGSASKSRINGWVYGAGFETFLLGNMGVRLEALRYEWRPEGLTSDAIDTGKLKSSDTHARAAVIFRLN
jgi:outer membrane immunogenic protein